jgi:hypothetical protein
MIFTDEDIDFLSITDNQFEEVCFELLIEMGYQKLIWRLGGADNGRDIEGFYQNKNPLVEVVEEKWFFECKRYEAGVPPEQLNSKIAWADAEKPKHVVFFISSYLSNNARTWLEKISRDKPYFIHVIEGKSLKGLILKHPNIVTKYFVSQYEKLLLDTRNNWLVHGVYPDVATLLVLLENLDFSKLSENEIGFFWSVAKLKESELDEPLSGDQQLQLDILFYDVTKHSNTASPAISDEQDIRTLLSSTGVNVWEFTYPHYLVANILLSKSNKPKPALYSLIWDSEGEGVEVLITATSNFPVQIRHITENAGSEAVQIYGYLCSKGKSD